MIQTFGNDFSAYDITTFLPIILDYSLVVFFTTLLQNDTILFY